MSPSYCKTLLILVAVAAAFLAQNDVVLADSTFVVADCVTKAGVYSDLDNFYINLQGVMSDLLQDISDNPSGFFSNATEGSGGDQAFGLFYCNGALEGSDCVDCVVEASQQIQSSCTTKEAIVYYQECTLRYANRDIFSQVEISPFGSATVNQNASDAITFSNILTTTLTGVIKEAAFNTTSNPPAYATALVDISSTKSLEVLAQCTPDIVGTSCNECLQAAFANMSSCCTNKADAVVLLPSCQLLYTIEDSSDGSTTPSTPSTTSPAGKGKFGNGAGSAIKHNLLVGIMTAIGVLYFMSLEM